MGEILHVINFNTTCSFSFPYNCVHCNMHFSCMINETMPLMIRVLIHDTMIPYSIIGFSNKLPNNSLNFNFGTWYVNFQNFGK